MTQGLGPLTPKWETYTELQDPILDLVQLADVNIWEMSQQIELIALFVFQVEENQHIKKGHCIVL